MRIFISHKSDDSSIALCIKTVLEQCGVTAYLDLLDTSITNDGEQLTAHIKKKLNECSDVMVVMSERTRSSWWVPFEIGMAAQTDMPTATYLGANVMLPEYLSYWPRLKNDSDIRKYVLVREQVKQQILNEQRINSTVYASRTSQTRKFYAELKKSLNQR